MDTVVVTAPDAAIAVLQPTLSDAIAAAQLYANIASTAEVAAVAAEAVCNNSETIALAAAASATLSAAAAQAAAAGVGFGVQAADKVYASPAGSSGAPTFRSLVNADLPSSLAPTSIAVSANATVVGTLSVTGATTLGAIAASATVSGSGFSAYLASPPAIGTTAAAAGQFTTLAAASWAATTAPSLTITPTANAISTLTSSNTQASSASSTTREFLTSIGFAINTSSVGAHVSGDDKVAQYIGATMASGGKAGWSRNAVMTLNTPLNANFFGALNDELDFNNNSGNDFHTAYSSVGVLTQFVGNLVLTGAGTNQADFAIAIGGLNTSTSLGMYNRGIFFLAGLGARQADIWSESASVSLLTDYGTHSLGLDLHATAYSTAAIYVHPVGSSPAAVTTTGTYSVDVFGDSSTSPYGIFLGGTYATAALYLGGALQVTALSANGAVATALGSVGPTGSHTTVQEWIQIKGTGGAIRYVPGF